MNNRGVYEDIAYLLFLVPFAASAVYAVSLWAGQGFSPILPESVYLTVTRSPALFLLGGFAVMLGIVAEVSIEQVERRSQTVASLSRRLQRLGVSSLVFATLAAWYANGFTLDFGRVVADVLVGRFNIVFPALLFLLSFLIATPLRLQRVVQPKGLAIMALLLVPVVLYEIGKRNADLGLAVAFVLLLAGGAILSRY